MAVLINYESHPRAQSEIMNYDRTVHRKKEGSPLREGVKKPRGIS